MNRASTTRPTLELMKMRAHRDARAAIVEDMVIRRVVPHGDVCRVS
jgi:hypothetical protein